MADAIEKIIAQTFSDMADALSTGRIGKLPRIALTGMGSEHGEENAMAAAVAAAKDSIDVVYIGTLTNPAVTTVTVADDEAGHAAMEAMLKSGEIDGAVTMHYPFPIGVSTVGRSVTPGCGQEMYLATTTGTSSTDRVEGMVKNAVAGIITAKACGIAEPSVGILNIDGARQTEKALRKLAEGGYPIRFAETSRADGGCVMRGNDVLKGSADVMITDPLTGNVLSKMLSAMTTGGSFEASGSGYGPGIGEGYGELVMIVSRASGAPVIANAIRFAAELVRGNVFSVAKAEYEAANRAGLAEILKEIRSAGKGAAGSEAAAQAVTAPPKEIVTEQIPGIEVMDIDDAVQVLWKVGIYAESGMGCTGPIIRISTANKERAAEELRKAGYIS